MYHSEFAWPCFSCLDQVETVDGPIELLPGMYFLNPPLEPLQRNLEGFTIEEHTPDPPLRRGWTTVPVVAFLLSRNRITWADITHKVVATSSLPKDFFKPIVDHLEACARRSGTIRERAPAIASSVSSR